MAAAAPLPPAAREQVPGGPTLSPATGRPDAIQGQDPGIVSSPAPPPSLFSTLEIARAARRGSLLRTWAVGTFLGNQAVWAGAAPQGVCLQRLWGPSAPPSPAPGSLWDSSTSCLLGIVGLAESELTSPGYSESTQTREDDPGPSLPSPNAGEQWELRSWLVGTRDGAARLEASLVFSYEVTG